MSKHVIVGSGPIGSGVARLLAERGESVRVVTRSGTGPAHPLIERVAADATDADRLTELTHGASALYNCANPKYTQWEALWPPMAAAMLTAAQRSGAVLTITGNLYGYGPVPGGRMTEDSPLAATGRKGRVRIKMWQDALASGVRTVEVRGSDYIGAGASSVFSAVLLPAITKGRTAWAPGDIDAPHTFTYTGDMARALADLAGDERAWGRAWHVPSAPALSVRALADRYFALSGAKPVPIRQLPRFVMRTAGVVVPMARELAEMDYQFYAPFIMDSSLTERTFGLTATDLDVSLREVAADVKSTLARRM
ncbi:NAD-dependent epimerase [Actinoplanes sp. ATCC 53533]|uniref:NAD-dependent epimerase/dehydratase family protein n=1 Tax=Actinoplanes sp. ATCC 53533 TaxID=1288362 RepID=UPI000F7A0181|nr:NAD-dependent epimerase/dehydratase family protein [Actinoplanes sp. ATCC 53533]RSM49744.1 NAD-dependent epimerase [Actinoplanes sp. ATCC 53533]